MLATVNVFLTMSTAEKRTAAKEEIMFTTLFAKNAKSVDISE
jgi:hypothetical protein